MYATNLPIHQYLYIYRHVQETNTVLTVDPLCEQSVADICRKATPPKPDTFDQTGISVPWGWQSWDSIWVDILHIFYPWIFCSGLYISGFWDRLRWDERCWMPWNLRNPKNFPFQTVVSRLFCPWIFRKKRDFQLSIFVNWLVQPPTMVVLD